MASVKFQESLTNALKGPRGKREYVRFGTVRRDGFERGESSEYRAWDNNNPRGRWVDGQLQGSQLKLYTSTIPYSTRPVQYERIPIDKTGTANSHRMAFSLSTVAPLWYLKHCFVKFTSKRAEERYFKDVIEEYVKSSFPTNLENLAQDISQQIEVLIMQKAIMKVHPKLCSLREGEDIALLESCIAQLPNSTASHTKKSQTRLSKPPSPLSEGISGSQAVLDDHSTLAASAADLPSADERILGSRMINRDVEIKRNPEDFTSGAMSKDIGSESAKDLSEKQENQHCFPVENPEKDGKLAIGIKTDVHTAFGIQLESHVDLPEDSHESERPNSPETQQPNSNSNNIKTQTKRARSTTNLNSVAARLRDISVAEPSSKRARFDELLDYANQTEHPDFSSVAKYYDKIELGNKVYVREDESTVPIESAYFESPDVLVVDGETYSRGKNKGRFSHGWRRMISYGEPHGEEIYKRVRFVFELGPEPRPSIKKNGVPAEYLGQLAQSNETLILVGKRPFKIDRTHYLEYELLLEETD